MSQFITREDLTSKSLRRFDEFPVAINGQERTCRIQSLSELEQSTYEAETNQGSGEYSERLKTAKRRLIVLCVVDGSGRRVLQDADVKAMESQDGALIAEIFDRCLMHIRMKSTDFEALVKNSDATGDASET